MSETVLLLGGGGREHAIARALEDSDATLYAAASNRNPGIDAIADGFELLEETETAAVVAYAEKIEATLAIIGPETPLEAGVVDALEAAGIYAFGPREAEARIETDKRFQREFMAEHDIPGTPEFETFEDDEAACAYIDDAEEDLVVKPAGLTGGKGVKVIGDQVSKEGAKEYIRSENYEEIVLEERLIGEEFTVQAVVANGDVAVTPAIQDHKRAYEGDEGPNTGGMGSYSDDRPHLPFMDIEEYDAAIDILDAVVEALQSYRGVLYGQFMLTTEGPKVVEFNARFGDPEAMNTLPVLETDFLDVLVAARDGERLPTLEFAPDATVCKYAVPAGYPTDPEADSRVVLDETSVGDALLFYASVDAREDAIFSTTSRSFAVVGVADTIREAEAQAEAALEAVGDGFRIRHDIGTEELVESRIDHMRELRDASR